MSVCLGSMGYIYNGPMCRGGPDRQGLTAGSRMMMMSCRSDSPRDKIKSITGIYSKNNNMAENQEVK